MISPLWAQIYADFTVSHGGSPLGTFRVRLDYDKAPRTCANFIGLATGQRAWLDTQTGQIKQGMPYFDGLKFHRLVHNFIIQGGDPQGNGQGGPGYSFLDEYHPDLKHDGAYILSMANSGIATNGSQFFITLDSTPHLDNKHSVFGEVINDATYPNSRAIIDGFMNATNFPTTSSAPDLPIVMESVVISGPSLAGFDIEDSALKLPVVRGVATPVTYDSVAQQYQMSWPRKPQAEYLAAFSTDLNAWTFVSSRFLLSLDADNHDYTISGVSTPKFFSRLAEVDYSLVDNAPSLLTSTNNQFVIDMGSGESVTLTFDGGSGGTWEHSNGSTGSLSGVSWADAVGTTGLFAAANPQARFISLGQLQANFDSPVGTEGWHSINFPLSFHTPTSGWCDGQVVINNPTGSGTVPSNKRVSFTYISD